MRVCAAALVVAALLGLTGCSSGGSDKPTVRPPSGAPGLPTDMPPLPSATP